MKIFLHNGFREALLLTSERVDTYNTLESAMRFLVDFTSDPANLEVVREAVKEIAPYSAAATVEVEELLEQAATLMANGELCVIQSRPKFSGPGIELEQEGRADLEPGAPEDEAVTPTEEPSWIEIELVGEDGSPVPDEKFWIKLTDGREEEGTLDSEGKVRFDDIPPGVCVVKFPDLDEEAWEAVTAIG